MVDVIFKYFPELTDIQKEKYSALLEIYSEWNNRINVISRKDMDNFYINHVLHSLAIGKIFRFPENLSVLDAGTGGGFPGIPLAILFPRTRFVLLDSIQKKIKVVTEVIKSIDLKNAEPVRSRVEEHHHKYEFIISRAVAAFPDFVRLTSSNLKNGKNGNGIFYLKGGDLSEELMAFAKRVIVRNIKELFDEPFFETKKIVYLPADR
jgi:16S rRNA (guanine527-N7)-methyltransferase